MYTPFAAVVGFLSDMDVLRVDRVSTKKGSAA